MPRQVTQDPIDISVDLAAELTTLIDDTRVAFGTRIWCRAAAARGIWVYDPDSVAVPDGTTVVASMSGVGRWVRIVTGGSGSIVTATAFASGGDPADTGGERLSNGTTSGVYAESNPTGTDVHLISLSTVNVVQVGDAARQTVIFGTRSSITPGPLHAGLVEITSDAAGYTWTEAELGNRVAVITGLTSAKTQRWDTAAGSVERAALVVNNTAYGYTLVRADGGGTGTYIPALGQQWIYSDPSANGGLGEIYGNPKIITLELLSAKPALAPNVGGAFIYASTPIGISSASYNGALIVQNGNSNEGREVITTVSPSVPVMLGSRVIFDKIFEGSILATGPVAQLLADYTLDDDFVGNVTVVFTARRFTGVVYTTTFVKKIEAGVSRSNGGIAVVIGQQTTLSVDGTGFALDATLTAGANAILFTLNQGGTGAGDAIYWDVWATVEGRIAQ